MDKWAGDLLRLGPHLLPQLTTGSVWKESHTRGGGDAIPPYYSKIFGVLDSKMLSSFNQLESKTTQIITSQEIWTSPHHIDIYMLSR